jgi:D-glycero-D-manno-heptose 1,7-bisphosphate phosphatase
LSLTQNLKNKTIFFDRDGIVNIRIVKDYIKYPEQFHFLNDFLEFFIEIKKRGYLAILVTNQQGIGKNLMTENELMNVHEYMQSELLRLTDYCFDDIFFCPELAETGSWRRKPNPGMLLEAIDKWNVDIENSWMVGDHRTDAIAGKAANLRTILIGKYTKEEVPQADFILDNLKQAIKMLDLLNPE